MSAADLGFAYAHCALLVREGDPDRYHAALFAPAAARPHLMALYAFAQEAARAREAASTPLTGEIRLQWWRDALQGEARGDVAANPVAAALEATVARCRLPREPLIDLLEARLFDVYDDPMPSSVALEGYCGETSSVLMRLAALVLTEGAEPGGAAATGHAGVAYALAGLLRALPWHARRGQVYLPADLLARYGVTRDDVVSGRGGPGLVGAVAEMRASARHHLAAFRAQAATLSPVALPALLPTALVDPLLAAMERQGYQPLQGAIDLPRWRRIWIYWRAARRGI